MSDSAALLKQAVTASTPAAALEKLVLAWQVKPTTELEAAIIALDGTPAPFDRDTVAFKAAVKKAQAKDRGALLASVTTGTLADVQARLEAVASWSSDPRTSRTLVQLLSGVPWSSDSSKRAWTAAFAVMVKQNDGRFVALAKVLPSKWKVRASMQTWLERAFSRAVESMKPLEVTATADEKKALEAVVKAFAKPVAPPKAPGRAKDEHSLLAAIYSNPADDAPRHVLADLLQEKNHPRGEFIALQLAGDEKGANRLLKTNAKQWVGALAPVLGADVEFRRGFPAAGKTKFRHQADAEAYGSLAEWATLEQLEWGTPTPIPKGQAPFCRFIGPAFRHLRHADGPHLQSLLDASEPWALESLAVSVESSNDLRALGEKLPTLFPKLRRLELQGAKPEWLAALPNAKQLDELGASAWVGDWAAGWSSVHAVATKTLTVPVARSTGNSAWRFTRGSDGRFSKLVLTYDGTEPPQRHVDYAEKLPAGFLESFEVVAGKRVKPDSVALVTKALHAAAKKAGSATRPVEKKKKTATTAAPREFMRIFSIDETTSGEVLVVDSDGAQRIDPDTNALVGSFGSQGIGAAAMTPDGTHVAVLSREVTLLSLPDFREVWSSKVTVEDSRGMQVTSDSVWHFARTGSERYALKTGKLLEKAGPATRLVGVSPTTWLSLQKGDGFLVGPASKKPKLELPGVAACLVENEQLLVASEADGVVTLTLTKTTTGEEQGRASLKASRVRFFPSRSGRLVAVAHDAGCDVLDVSTMKTKRFPVKGLNAAGFSRDETHVLLAARRLERHPL
ncbi:MAG: TIGR02996 domain-containing protein [Myxococcales bacterium]|nr:TIGR02996 domain-containing protein [Myxococcales bacterium]